MARRFSEDADIKEKVIKVFAEERYERGGGSDLRIISWVINGKERPPVLEKREKWITEDGNVRIGKNKSLTAQDFWTILEHAREIGQIMGVPAAKLAGLLDSVVSFAEQERVPMDSPAVQESISTPEPSAEAVGAGDDPWGK